MFGCYVQLFAGQFEPHDGDRSKDGFLRLAQAMEHPSSEILYLCHSIAGRIFLLTVRTRSVPNIRFEAE